MSRHTAQAPTPGLRRTLKELPASAVILLTGVSVNRLGSQVQIFLVLYLTGIGFSPARAGATLSVYGLGSILGVFASGPVSDRIGPNRTIVLAMAGSGAFVGALPFTRAYPATVVVCLGIGALSQLYRPAALALLASMTPKDRLVVVSAAYRLGLNIGVTLAPLLGVLLIRISYDLVFAVDGGTSILFAVVAAFAIRTGPVIPAGTQSSDPHAGPESGPGPGPVEAAGRSFQTLLKNRRFLIVIAAMLATALAESQYQSVLPLQIVARGLPTGLYAAVLAINGAMVIAFELPLTPFIQRLPMRLVIGAGSALIGFGIALFGLPAGMAPFLIGALVWTTGEIISAPSISAYPALIAPPRQSATYISTLSTSQTLGYAVGPALGTALYQFDHSAPWLLCLALGAVAGAGMWIGVRKPDDAPAEQSPASGSHLADQARDGWEPDHMQLPVPPGQAVESSSPMPPS